MTDIMRNVYNALFLEKNVVKNSEVKIFTKEEIAQVAKDLKPPKPVDRATASIGPDPVKRRRSFRR